ncbi:hypothetical protein EJ07DRAFT_160269 [Lizonia empirigonia]|nr:hypothetical protein EJ07DRAFT_160269 [Lizonia empirigonia]
MTFSMWRKFRATQAAFPELSITSSAYFHSSRDSFGKDVDARFVLFAIFFASVSAGGALVLLAHCLCVGRCILLTPIRKHKSNAKPALDIEANSAASPKPRKVLPRPDTTTSSVSIRSSASTSTQADFSSSPRISPFSTHYHNASRLSLPPRPHPGLEVIDHILLLETLDQPTDAAPSTPLYAFPNTPYVGQPGVCYAERQKWENAVRWVKNGGKFVRMRFWSWAGRERNVRLVLGEDGRIGIVGLSGISKSRWDGEAWETSSAGFGLSAGGR